MWYEILFSYKALCSFIKGYWHIKKLPQPIITVFGGKFVGRDSFYYQQAYQLGKELARLGVSLLTGGGPGIMEAALCGAMEFDVTGKQVLGIGIPKIDENFSPACNRQEILVQNFDVRKRLLINYSSALVVFPGGLGTLDELAQTLNLIKVKKLSRVPIILFGKEYWQSLMKWIITAVDAGLIDPSMRDVCIVTDDILEIVAIIERTTIKK